MEQKLLMQQNSNFSSLGLGYMVIYQVEQEK